MNPSLVQFSKFLSLVLRHEPDRIGLLLDPQGWAEVDELLAKAAAHGTMISREMVAEIVATNEKKRFAFSEDGQRIRASQGHSIDVDLQLDPTQPPSLLFHGTAERFLDSIRQQGLLKQARQHVHLSADEATARKVGQRHGRAVILRVKSQAMWEVGIPFFLSANGVWLTEAVAVEYLCFRSSKNCMSGRILAIGDVHGCNRALVTLLGSLAVTPSDTVVLLGDLVDRGPATREVVQRVLALRDECRVVLLCGNHEEMLREAIQGRGLVNAWLQAGGNATLESYGRIEDIPPSHIRLLLSAQPFWETETEIFVHASLEAASHWSIKRPIFCVGSISAETSGGMSLASA